MELERLLFLWQEGSISAKELGELKTMLQHPEARRTLFEEFFMSSTIMEALKLESGDCGSGNRFGAPAGKREIVERGAGRRGEQRKTPEIRWGRWLSVAACLAIVVGSLVYNEYRATRFSDVVIAHIKATAPGVRIIRGGESIIAVIDMGILEGDRIQTGSEQTSTLSYENEDTEVVIDENTTLDVGAVEEGKRFHLEKGVINASVDPQPADKPMIVSTPQATAEVKGTRFGLNVGPEETWLRVDEGRVDLTRISDGESLQVRAGRLAVAGKGLGLKDYPAGTNWVDGEVLMQDDFETGLSRWAKRGWRLQGRRRVYASLGEEFDDMVSVVRDTEKQSNVLEVRGHSKSGSLKSVAGITVVSVGGRSHVKEYDYLVTGVGMKGFTWYGKRIAKGQWFHVREEIRITGDARGREIESIAYVDGKEHGRHSLSLLSTPINADIVFMVNAERKSVRVDNLVVRRLVPVPDRVARIPSIQ